MKDKRIVIIGGMGPQASHAFHGKLLSASRQLHDGEPENFPNITHLSLQIPEFFGSSDNEDAAVEIINRHLDALNINEDTIICMPCNTAHKLVDRLHLGQGVFVSMAEAVGQKLRTIPVNKIGLLASPNTLSSGFYAEVLTSAGKITVSPTDTEAKNLESVIAAVIREETLPELRNKLNAVCVSLENRGAELILLGCTEFSIVGVDSRRPVIDSLNALCAAVLEEMLV